MSALRLAPDWARPESWVPALAAFCAASRPGGPRRLLLEAGPGAPPPGVLGEMLGPVCDWAADGGAFGEVEVVERAPAGAIAVAGAGEVLEALGAAPSPLPEAAPALVARAAEAKRVADAARAALERHLIAAAPDPWRSPEPLVSVRIPTWKGHELLVSRAIPSVLGGGYPNVEVVVCSDGPDPVARAAVEGLADPRVRYRELAARPRYASHFQSFWMTAGSHAANGALEGCAGDFIAPLDHDDAFTEDHVAVLLTAARESGADLVYGQGICEQRGGPWTVIGSAPLACGRITHGSVLHSRRLAHFRFDPHCWLLDEPGDWNLWRRMAEAGARVAHVERVVLVHFREKTSIEADPSVGARELAGPVAADPAALAADLLGTDARWLLSVERRSAALRRAA